MSAGGDGWRLVVCDVEGCLIPSGRSGWDHRALAALDAYNRAARRGDYPPLTLASGRPAQFVDAVGQAVGVFLPVVCENGAVLYDPAAGRSRLLFGDAERRLADRVRRAVAALYGGRVRIAAGKEICVSVIPLQPPAGGVRGLLRELAGRLEEVLGTDAHRLHFTYSAGAVDITPAGTDKAAGLRLLLGELDVAARRVIAVGDGGNDLPMLRMCGAAAAPANARPEVAGAAGYVAPATEARGVLQILARFTGFRPPA